MTHAWSCDLLASWPLDIADLMARRTLGDSLSACVLELLLASVDVLFAPRCAVFDDANVGLAVV